LGENHDGYYSTVFEERRHDGLYISGTPGNIKIFHQISPYWITF